MPCNSQSGQIDNIHYTYSYTTLVNILFCTHEYLCGKTQNLYKLSLDTRWSKMSLDLVQTQTQTNKRDQTHNALQHKYLGKTNQGTRRLNVKYSIDIPPNMLCLEIQPFGRLWPSRLKWGGYHSPTPGRLSSSLSPLQ